MNQFEALENMLQIYQIKFKSFIQNVGHWILKSLSVRINDAGCSTDISLIQ